MYKLLRSLLFRCNPETAHHLILDMMQAMPQAVALASSHVGTSESLTQTLWGLPFIHPVGLAAGLDKNADAVEGLFRCGFSFVEVGTVTPRPQPGNPSPRLFRLLEDEALINRMGFNNRGVQALCDNLTRATRRGPVGINIGKNKTTPNQQALDDYVIGLTAALPLADYIVLNVSSPNTPGLRDLQEEASLVPLVEAILAERDRHRAARFGGQSGRVPVLVKLAPDLADSAVEHLGERLMASGIDGFIATNTTIDRTGLTSMHANQMGGLSGRPLATRSTEVIRLLFRVTEGRVPIIGSGGIHTVDDAWDKIVAGANLLQIYTGFIYEGPHLIREIVRGLHQRLEEHGFASLRDAVGSGVTG